MSEETRQKLFSVIKSIIAIFLAALIFIYFAWEFLPNFLNSRGSDTVYDISHLLDSSKDAPIIDDTEQYSSKNNYPFIDIMQLKDPVEFMLLDAVMRSDKNTSLPKMDEDEFKVIVDRFLEVIGKTYYRQKLISINYIMLPNSINVKLIYDNDELDKEKEYQKIAQEVATSIFKEGMSDYEKILAAHDYLVLSVRYDQAVVDDVTYNVSHSAYGAFVNERAVCDGYGDAFNYLMTLAGIESRLVTSNEMNHAWSMVRLDGQWYHCDVTNDDPIPDIINSVNYDYFLKNDEYMKADNPLRMNNDGPKATAPNYNMQIYSNQKYTLDGNAFSIKLVDNLLLKYNIIDNAIDLDNPQVIANNVSSWVGVGETYSIIYTKNIDNTINSISFDGKKARELGEFSTSALIIDVYVEGSSYILTCVGSLKSDAKTQIECRIQR